jgi:hypothetical protein
MAYEPDQEESMRQCFGVNLGWFMEDLIGEPDRVQECYGCPDFDACQKLALVRQITMLRFEVRHCARSIVQALGGSFNPR